MQLKPECIHPKDRLVYLGPDLTCGQCGGVLTPIQRDFNLRLWPKSFDAKLCVQLINYYGFELADGLELDYSADEVNVEMTDGTTDFEMKITPTQCRIWCVRSGQDGPAGLHLLEDAINGEWLTSTVQALFGVYTRPKAYQPTDREQHGP